MIYEIHKKFFYLIVIFVLISGSVGDELINFFSILSIFITMVTILHITNKQSYSLTGLAIVFFSIFVFLITFTNYGIVIQDRFSGGGDFDSSGTATLKFMAKCLIIAVFFPVQVKIEKAIAGACKTVLIYTGIQAITTASIINIVGVQIEDTNFLFPLVGGVADWEPYPLYVIFPSLDFIYFRPRFIFREPQGLGYFIMVMYFMYAMLANSVSKRLKIFVLIILLTIIAKAALIIFIVYMATQWVAIKLKNKRKLLYILIFSFLMVFFIIVFTLLGDYILSRIAGTLLFDYSSIGLMPLGINSGLWLGFNSNQSVDISYFTIFYELGIILGIIYIASLGYLFFKINKTRSQKFICLFPIYVSILIFIASGSTYSSGGCILIMYYLHILSSRSIVCDLKRAD